MSNKNVARTPLGNMRNKCCQNVHANTKKPCHRERVIERHLGKKFIARNSLIMQQLVHTHFKLFAYRMFQFRGNMAW